MVLMKYFENFKLFPTYDYKFKLLDNENDSIERLNRRTEHSDKLVSKMTDKSFIGKVDNNKFKIITSEIGKGAVWVMDGYISNEKCEVNMVLNYPFRVMFSILLCFPVIGFIIQLFTEADFSLIVMVLLGMIGQLLIIRYVILDFVFKKFARTSLYKLRDVVDFELIG